MQQLSYKKPVDIFFLYGEGINFGKKKSLNTDSNNLKKTFSTTSKTSTFWRGIFSHGSDILFFSFQCSSSMFSINGSINQFLFI